MPLTHTQLARQQRNSRLSWVELRPPAARRPVIFLHVYHHVTVLLYCWHSYSSRIASVRPIDPHTHLRTHAAAAASATAIVPRAPVLSACYWLLLLLLLLLLWSSTAGLL